MNPSPTGIWCNPPPPGTDEDCSNSSLKKEKEDSPERVIDRIDPYLKSSDYIKYERKLSTERSKRRSRSRSRHRRRRSKSRSRGRHRHRRRHHSSSRSRSRSHRRHRRSRYSRSHSRSRSRSKSHRSHRSRRHRSRSRHKSRSQSNVKIEPAIDQKNIKVEEAEEEEIDEEDGEVVNENVFKNDGSFMEMFKKMQEEKQKEAETSATAEIKPPLPAFGKRRGGKVLKTGMVQKNKTLTQEESDAHDAWTMYMKEVKRYKEACCDDDSKTRLLVK